MSRTGKFIWLGAVLLGAAPVALFPFSAQTVAAKPEAKQHAYVGIHKCRKCHFREYLSWRKTPMAHALKTLAPGAAKAAKLRDHLDPNKDYRKDKDCVVCHTVGFDKPGGWNFKYGAGRDHKGLAGVGCEMCHGAAGDWLKPGLHDRALVDPAVLAKRLPAMEAAGFNPKPTKKTCVKCHNKRSPSFRADFWSRRDKGVHKHFKLRH